VHTHSAAPLSHPGGVAISGNSVLVGGDGCTDDAVVYQKGTDGNWGITSRIDDHQGACHPEGLRVDLNYDYALLSARGENHATAWHRNGNVWATAGVLTLPSGVTVGDFPFALEGSTAVAPGNYVFRRNGSTWTQTGRAIPVDFDNTEHAGAYQVVQRDGVLATVEPSQTAAPDFRYPVYDYPGPYVYVQTTPGHFEHVAMMNPSGLTRHVDVSARTMVAASDYAGSGYVVQVFTLPTPLIPPSPIVDNFETHDLSEFTFNGGQFALAQRGSNDVLAQNSANGMAIALTNDSDWTDYQSIEADITPAYSNSDSWVGLVVRYVDANNFYYAVVRKNLTYAIYKRVDGTDTQLETGNWSNQTAVVHVLFYIDGLGQLVLQFDGQILGDTIARDTTFTHGRAGLATFQTRADFDNVHVSGTEQQVFPLYSKFYDTGYPITGPYFTKVGGRWEVLKDPQDSTVSRGLAQQNPVGDALGYIGVPVENQYVISYMHLDAFNSSTTGGWIGLLARYQDSKNYYYAAIRSNNQIQIRKVVNGVVTVLAGAPFSAQPGRNYYVAFVVINDELRVFVDQSLVLTANDDSFSSGQYGIGTHSATATWEYVRVIQP
jgi:hypothetical protein